MPSRAPMVTTYKNCSGLNEMR